MPNDCHIHIALDGIDFRTAAARCQNENALRTALESYRRKGIAYLRDGGDKWGCCLAARTLAPEYGIEYAAPGPALYFAGSYGSFLGLPFSDLATFRTQLGQVSALQADFVKVILTGVMDFNAYGQITGTPVPAPLMHDIVAEAHEQGFAVMAHTNGASEILAAVEAGVDSIEHGYYSNDESRAALAESETVWVPTVAPISNLIGTGIASDETLLRIRDGQLAAIRDVASLDGFIALGSDAGSHGVLHAQGALDELACLQEALGAQTERVLARGNAQIRKRFAARCR